MKSLMIIKQVLTCITNKHRQDGQHELVISSNTLHQLSRGRGGRDRMEHGFTIT